MTLEVAMAGPFKPDYKPTIKQKSPLSKSPLESIVNAYIESLESFTDLVDEYNHYYLYELIAQKIDPATRINHDDINTFAQLTQEFEDHDVYTITTGLWISCLMKRAHGNGCTKFYFDWRGLKPLDYVGFKLEGKSHNPIKVMIEGTVGEELGLASRNVVYYCRKSSTIYIDASHKNVTFYIGNLDTGPIIRKFMEYIRFKVNGLDRSLYQMAEDEWEGVWNHAKKIIAGDKP